MRDCLQVAFGLCKRASDLEPEAEGDILATKGRIYRIYGNFAVRRQLWPAKYDHRSSADGQQSCWRQSKLRRDQANPRMCQVVTARHDMATRSMQTQMPGSRA